MKIFSPIASYSHLPLRTQKQATLPVQIPRFGLTLSEKSPEKLHDLVRYGDMSSIRAALDHPSAQQQLQSYIKNRIPLMIALERGDWEITKLILDHTDPKKSPLILIDVIEALGLKK